MQSLFAPGADDALIGRLDRLTPDRRPQWGQMSAPQMVSHLACAYRNALGELDARPVVGPLQHAPLNWLAIHVLPWPKAKAQSPPEFLAADRSFDADVIALRDLIRRGARRADLASWPESPVFGRISARDYGVLLYKHADHHFRQFGI